jgi:hypothetical protein
MIMSTRDSVARATRAQGVGLALFLALGVAAVPLAAQVRAQGGHSDGSAGEASHARSEPGGDRGSWNHGGSSGGSSGGGSSASPGSGSSGSGNDGSSAQPRSGSGGDRGQWHDRGNRGGGDHGDHGHSRGGGHFGYGYGRGYYTNPWWGWWGWGWGWGEPYGYGGGYYGRGYGDGDDQGALDLDIWPGDTQVWLDGQNIGTVDDFDGFPTYLWLEKGTYDLVFYRDGYQTLARQYSVYPGLTIDVGDRLVPGPSVRPEDLPTKTHVRRDTRVEDEHERTERIDRDRGRYRDDDSNDDRSVAPSGDDEQGRLILSIEPDDASVYLDGKFIGTAEEISRLHRGLVVDAGQHRISVVRPGRRGSEQTVTVRPGAEQEVQIQLESTGE